MLSEYDPRYLELWRDASTRTINIPLESRQAAITMRHRLYRCRKDMEAEKHQYAEAAAKVSISIIATNKAGEPHKFSTLARLPGGPQAENHFKWSLQLDNTDKIFDDALAKVGYAVPEAPNRDD